MPGQLVLDFRDASERTALWSTLSITDRQRTITLYARLALRAESLDDSHADETHSDDTAIPELSKGNAPNE